MANPPYLYSRPQPPTGPTGVMSTPFPPTGQALPGDAWGAPQGAPGAGALTPQQQAERQANLAAMAASGAQQRGTGIYGGSMAPTPGGPTTDPNAPPGGGSKYNPPPSFPTGGVNTPNPSPGMPGTTQGYQDPNPHNSGPYTGAPPAGPPGSGTTTGTMNPGGGPIPGMPTGPGTPPGGTTGRPVSYTPQGPKRVPTAIAGSRGSFF